MTRKQKWGVISALVLLAGVPCLSYYYWLPRDHYHVSKWPGMILAAPAAIALYGLNSDKPKSDQGRDRSV